MNIKHKRKRKRNKVTPITIYLSKELISKIKTKAIQQGLTMAGYIRMLLINSHKD